MSGKAHQTEVELDAVVGHAGSNGGVAHGALLVRFTEAVMGPDDAALDGARAAALQALGEAAFVDACATIGAFNVVDRIADATGIPLDDGLVVMSQQVRDELDLGRFASAANTPGAR